MPDDQLFEIGDTSLPDQQLTERQIPPQLEHDFLEALLFCRSARDQVAILKRTIAELEAQLADEEPVREAAMARRSAYLAGMGVDPLEEDDQKVIDVLGACKEAEKKCSDLSLTIQGQQKLLAEAERLLATRRAERAEAIAAINRAWEV